MELVSHLSVSQLIGEEFDTVLSEENQCHWLKLLEAECVELLNQAMLSQYLLRAGMVLDHSFDDSQHQDVLRNVFWSISLRFFELKTFIDHELEKTVELGDIGDRVFDEVLVDGDAFNNVDNPFYVELAREGLGRDGSILAWR